MGRIRAGEQPLWSSFVWRNEVADSFVELLAAPWMARAATGTPVLGAMLRLLGSRIGRGVWCESYWLPEADLVTLGDGATVNRGCVVQTHLFHDRIMQIDSVDWRTVPPRPHCVPPPAFSIGAGSPSARPAGDARRPHPAGTRWRETPYRRGGAEGESRRRGPGVRGPLDSRGSWNSGRKGPRRQDRGTPRPHASTRGPLPSAGNHGYRVSCYELDLTYR